MKSRRITEITLESNEVFTIRRSTGAVRVPCPQCGALSLMVTPGEAASLFRVGVRTIYREVEAGRFHFLETDSGSVLICLDSLQKAALPSSGNSTLQINQIKEIPS